MRIYLAGPLFTAAERAFNVRLRDLLLMAGHEVWLPQGQEPREKTARELFLKDVEGIEWADALVGNMDGPDPDSGTCWECGYAYRRKKIVLFRTDFRGIGEATLSPFNIMLSESADHILKVPFGTADDVAKKLVPLLK